MAGTLAEQAQLASDVSFINRVRVAMIFRCKKIEDGSLGRETESGKLQRQLSLVRDIISDSEGYAPRVAWLVAVMDNSISAGAPVLPTDSDLQTAVNTQMAKLWA